VTVLVVDDEEDIRSFLTACFRRLAWDVVVAHDGSQALAMLSAHRVDVVMCDLMMPGKEGIETIQDLRRANPSVKIVAMSGGGTVGHAHSLLSAARHLGADAVLEKPFSLEQATATVRSLLPAP
jgi:DNA-binding response OmpR family regulator